MQIVVHGAGIFGLSVAWSCMSRGARVTVVDPAGPGAGASGGIVGALSPHVPEAWNTKKAFQFESLILAETFWSDVSKVGGGDPGYARSGRVQPLPDARAVDLAQNRAQSAATLWQGRFDWSVKPADTFADLVHSPSGYVVLDTLTARLHPRKAVAALVAALTAKGAEFTDKPASGDVTVHATGVAGLQELNGLAGEKLIGTGVKGQAALLACDMRARLQVFADTIHIVPHGDGTVAVGSTSEREWADPSTTDEQLDHVIDRARAACPLLREAPVIERWAGLRPRSRSRAPMLGHHPLYPGHFIANGGFKIGFGMAPVVGALMADLIVGGVDRIPAEFRPEASFT